MAKKIENEDVYREIIEVKTVLIGISGSPDGGLVKKVDNIEMHLKDLNGQVKTNTTFRKVGTWISGAIFTGMIVLGIAILTGAV